MSKKGFILLASGLVLFLLTCSPVQDELIVGSWQAISVEEEGAQLALDPSQIKLAFTENDTYTYESTLNYREAGSYFVDAKYLYTTDTVNQASTEKAVEIVLLTADSLSLKMNDNGNVSVL